MILSSDLLSISMGLGRIDEREIMRPAVRSFGILYLIGFVIFFGTALIPQAYQLLPGSAAVLYLNFVPIIWLKRYLLRQGKSNKEIQDLLFISYNTVKNPKKLFSSSAV